MDIHYDTCERCGRAAVPCNDQTGECGNPARVPIVCRRCVVAAFQGYEPVHAGR